MSDTSLTEKAPSVDPKELVDGENVKGLDLEPPTEEEFKPLLRKLDLHLLPFLSLLYLLSFL